MNKNVIVPINLLVKRIHKNAVEKGFWNVDPSSLAGRLMLVVTEIAEACEADRKGEPLLWFHDDGKPDGVAVEIIDAVIRCFDILGSMDIDVEEVMRKKMEYNEQKRGKLHGKNY